MGVPSDRLASQRSGLYYTPVSSRLRADEIAYIVRDCGARVFITSKTTADGGASTAAVTSQVQLRLMLDAVANGFTSHEEIRAAAQATQLPHEVEGSDML